MALLEHIGRGIDESAHMPSREAMGEMEDAKVGHCVIVIMSQFVTLF